jgi:hypothetical protein
MSIIKKKCERETCEYSVHSTLNNHTYNFCCRLCEKNGDHGLLCEKNGKYLPLCVKKLPRKIFVIGFNKTGTTSFHDLFLNEKIKSSHCVQPVLKMINKYDAFTDGVHYDFHEYYNKYPEGLFILNTRPIKKWLVSRFKHVYKDPTGFFKATNAWQRRIKSEAKLWPPNNTITNYWIEEREYHYENVLRFFDDKPHKLLIVNIERAGWENRVLEYIESPTKHEVKIHSFKRGDDEIHIEKRKNIYEVVDFCLSSKGYTGDELLVKGNNFSIEKYNTYL